MQDLFLKLATNPAFAAAKNPGAYLHQSAIHLALDWRKRKRPAANANLPERSDPAPLPGVAAATHEQWSRILDAAAGLPPATREAFVLHHIRQLPFDEIAAAMGKNSNQVRALCHKAITTLRSELGISDEEACRASE
jgi:RNA polymerase sigma-70 factor (ECF subfamily)